MQGMLGFLLVLGQVPGTEFYFTFAEILLILLTFFLYWEERLHHREFVRWLKKTHHKMGVSYRRVKRKGISYLKFKRYRIEVNARKTKRHIHWSLKRAYRATFVASYLAYRRFIRKSKLKLRRAKRAIIFASFILPKRKVRRSKLLIRRANRDFRREMYRSYRRLYRKLSSRTRRLNKYIKNSWLGNSYDRISVGLRSGAGN